MYVCMYVCVCVCVCGIGRNMEQTFSVINHSYYKNIYHIFSITDCPDISELGQGVEPISEAILLDTPSLPSALQVCH